MKNILYILLCLLVPALWGVAATHLFDALTRRKPQEAEPQTPTEFWVYEI
jgi:hypothetical protein